MNNQLLAYYNKELIALRELTREFARQYPKVASRLDMDEDDITDPYVERLLEGVSFLTARTQLKIDSEYANFVKRILEVLYPQFLTQTPASAIVKMQLSKKQTYSVLHRLNRGEVIRSLPIDEINNNVNCEFSVTQDLEITPLSIESVKYTASLDYLPQSVLKHDNLTKEYSALRVDFSLSVDGVCSDLVPNNLILYLGSDISKSSQLLYLLLNQCEKVVCHSYEQPHSWQIPISHFPAQLGFNDEQALNFNLNKNIPALRVMQEYIQLPEKFVFVEQTGIKTAIKIAEERGYLPLAAPQIEEVISEQGVNKKLVNFKKRYFSISYIFKKNIANLHDLVKTEDFAINAVPIVNLFRKRGIRFAVDIQNTEFHVVPDRTQPLNYEVHSVENVKGFDYQNNQKVRFTPIYQAEDNPSNSSNKYAFFSLRRESRVASEKVHLEGNRTSYTGSEVYLSLINQNAPILSENEIYQLSVDAWCTNRDLSLLIHRSTESDFLVENTLPVHGIKLISKMTRPKEAVDEYESIWSLLNLLNLNLLSLTKFNPNQHLHYFKELLLSFPHADSHQFRQQVNAIKNITIQPTSKIVRQGNNSGLTRGIHVFIIIDEGRMGGVHPYLFGSILNQYLKMTVSMNAFINLTLETLQQGELLQWENNVGERAIL